MPKVRSKSSSEVGRHDRATTQFDPSMVPTISFSAWALAARGPKAVGSTMDCINHDPAVHGHIDQATAIAAASACGDPKA